jgi:predicted metal-dependent peptidase
MNKEKLLDRAKSAVFQSPSSAFLGSVLCSLNIQWNSDIKTAQVSGTRMTINPEFFENLSDAERSFLLLHEVWHIARMHSLREGTRDHKIFNMACDIVINNDIIRNTKFSVPRGGLLDERYPSDISEEEVYEDLINAGPNQVPDQTQCYLADDLDPEPNKETQKEIINCVLKARAQCRNAGDIPGDVKKILDKMLKPKIDWKTQLQKYLTDILDYDYSWTRRNRRYLDCYLPGRVPDEGRLAHLAFFLDVSGSISEAELNRFNTEIKYIQEQLIPEKLTLIQFDTRIQNIQEYKEGDVFEKLEMIGGGGTSFRPVHQWIEKNRPTAAVIFTDLYAAPMDVLQSKTPVIWIVVNSDLTPPFGKEIHIEEEQE